MHFDKVVRLLLWEVSKRGIKVVSLQDIVLSRETRSFRLVYAK